MSFNLVVNEDRNEISDKYGIEHILSFQSRMPLNAQFFHRFIPELSRLNISETSLPIFIKFYMEYHSVWIKSCIKIPWSICLSLILGQLPGFNLSEMSC